MRATAYRAGLLGRGDGSAALDELVPALRDLGQKAALTPEQVVAAVGQAPHAAPLLAYSVDRQYLALRRELRL